MAVARPLMPAPTTMTSSWTGDFGWTWTLPLTAILSWVVVVVVGVGLLVVVELAGTMMLLVSLCQALLTCANTVELE